MWLFCLGRLWLEMRKKEWSKKLLSFRFFANVLKVAMFRDIMTPPVGQRAWEGKFNIARLNQGAWLSWYWVFFDKKDNLTPLIVFNHQFIQRGGLFVWLTKICTGPWPWLLIKGGQKVCSQKKNGFFLLSVGSTKPSFQNRVFKTSNLNMPQQFHPINITTTPPSHCIPSCALQATHPRSVYGCSRKNQIESIVLPPR